MEKCVSAIIVLTELDNAVKHGKLSQLEVMQRDIASDGVRFSEARPFTKMIENSMARMGGADYAAKTVAPVGYSEHHTGLALDLYLIIDGEDIVLNEEMMKHPDIWEKIHEKLAAHGFILRYLDGKEHITGYTSDDCTDFEPDSTIEDYQWWLALDEEDGWQLVTYGE